MTRTQGVAAALLAGALLVGSGCYGPGYYGGPAYQPQPAVVVGPGPIAPGPQPVGPPGPGMGMGGPQQIIGVGAGVGFIDMVDTYASGGFIAGVHANLYLSQFFGVQVDIGVGTVQEDLYIGASGETGEFTVVPIYASAFFSLPDARMPMIRYKLGVGTGFMAVQHNLVDLPDTEVISLFVLQSGSEFQFAPAGRVFAMLDLMFGSTFEDDGAGIWAPYTWDASVMLGVRFGVELGF